MTWMDNKELLEAIHKQMCEDLGQRADTWSSKYRSICQSHAIPVHIIYVDDCTLTASL